MKYRCTIELITILCFGILCVGGSVGFFWVGALDHDNKDIETNCTVVGYKVVDKTCTICAGESVFDYECWDYNYTGYVIFNYTITHNKILTHKFNSECGKNFLLYNTLEKYYPMGSDMSCYYRRTHPNQIVLGSPPNGIVLFVMGGVFAALGIFAIPLSVIKFCKNKRKRYDYW